MLIALFFLATIGITLFAFYELWLVVQFWRLNRRGQMPGPHERGIQKREGPPKSILVQLPLFNEGAVVRQLIKHVAALDYPSEALHIQILDDSTDETPSIVADTLASLPRDKASLFSHIRRAERTGYKAGALANGMRLSDSEFVAIFDADFIPTKNFLKSALIHSDAFDDPKVGFVQARWAFYNSDASLLTELQSLLLDRHFLVQKPVQIASGLDITFNGSAGIWRRSAIDEAGGWDARTITEDLDLTMRNMLVGRRGDYLPQVSVANEIPPSLHSFRLQQRRWAMGTAQTLRHLFGDVLSNGSFMRRANNLFSIAGYIIHPLLLSYALIWPILVLNGTNLVFLWTCQIALILGNLAAFAGLLTTYAVRTGKRPTLQLAGQAILAAALGVALMLSNALAFLLGFFRNGGVFMRTPKGANALKASVLKGGWAFLALESAFAVYALHLAMAMLTAGYIIEFQQTFFFGVIMFVFVALQLIEKWRVHQVTQEPNVAPVDVKP